ncbi:MAG: SGNH/GDSL hydrolase family protein [Planctomycetota bacterium]
MSETIKNRSILKRLAIAAAAPFVFFGIVEAIFAIFGAGNPDPFFIIDPNDATKMQRHPSYREFFASPPRAFLREKPNNGFRVAIVGESTVAGYPYFYATFCDRLALSLSDALPEKNCEVINAGMVGWTTFRLLSILDQCLEHKPDVVVWMVGHNEERSADNVLRLRSKVTNPVSYAVGDFLQLFHVTRWLLQLRTVGIRTFSPNETRSDPRIGPEADLIQSEFRAGLREAARKVKNAGARFVLTTMPRNARTIPPHGSASRAGSPDADSLFLKAKTLQQLGNCTEARKYYIEAAEQDLWPSRAREWTQRAIREAAAESSASPSKTVLVDLQNLFDANGECGVAGEEWLCDGVHPNLDGHRVIAQELLNAISQFNFADANNPAENQQFRFDRIRSEDAMRRAFGTPELEAFSNSRALGYAMLFDAFGYPEGEISKRKSAAAGARLQLENAHILVPGDARVALLLGTAEIVSGDQTRGARRLLDTFPIDRAATLEFAKIAQSSSLLLSQLSAAGIDIAEIAKKPGR